MFAKIAEIELMPVHRGNYEFLMFCFATLTKNTINEG